MTQKDPRYMSKLIIKIQKDPWIHVGTNQNDT